MIYTDCTITVKDNKSSIDNTIYLYRGDKEVQIYFTIQNNRYKYANGSSENLIESTDASYGQLVIKRPNATPIFTAITPKTNRRLLLTITADMIDEIQELGAYDFQIRLFDENKQSRITIPPVIGGIVIEEPIAIEDVTTTNEVNVAQVNNAVITSETALDVFDEQGNYIKTTWQDKDVITDAKLNKIEAGIEGVNQKIKGIRIDSTDQPQTAKPITEEVSVSGVTITNNDMTATITVNMADAVRIPLGTTTLDLDIDSIIRMIITSENDDIEKVIIKDIPNVEKIQVNCSNLDISGVDNLRRLHLSGDVCNNVENMTSIAEGLKDRNNMAWGSVVTQNQVIRKSVEDAFIQKDWYFGTDRKINTSQQPHFNIMNVADIWESAEYGEGRTYAVADTEIDDGGEGCTNALLNEFSSGDIPASNYLGKFSFCTNEPNFIGGTQHHHGLGVLSLIAMDGSNGNTYGIAPKAKFYMFKLGAKDGRATSSDYYRCINKATELNLDGLNISYGNSSNTTIDQTITNSDKNIAIAFADNKGILCCANGNEGTNTINEDGTVTSIHEGVQYPHNGSFSVAVGGISKNETMMYCSTCSDGLDFMAHAGGDSNASKKNEVLVRYPKNKTTGEIQFAINNGTSFASPMILGCVLLMKNLFYKKYKREATQRELVEYMSKRTRDMGLEAYQQGYGIFDFMAYNPNPKEVTKKL